MPLDDLLKSLEDIAKRTNRTKPPLEEPLKGVFDAVRQLLMDFPVHGTLDEASFSVLEPLIACFGDPGDSDDRRTEAMLLAAKSVAIRRDQERWNTLLTLDDSATQRLKAARGGLKATSGEAERYPTEKPVELGSEGNKFVHMLARLLTVAYEHRDPSNEVPAVVTTEINQDVDAVPAGEADGMGGPLPPIVAEPSTTRSGLVGDARSSRRPWTRLKLHKKVVVGAVMVVAVGTATAGVLLELSSSPQALATPSVASAEKALTAADAPQPGTVSSTLGFGDSIGGRPTIDYTGTSLVPTTPVIDSMVDVPKIGDERDFIRLGYSFKKQQGAFLVDILDKGFSPVVVAPSGATVAAWILIDNDSGPENNCNDLAGESIATNVRLRLAVWNSPDGSHHVLRAWISTDNSSPQWVTDAAEFVTAPGIGFKLDQSLSTAAYAIPPEEVMYHPWNALQAFAAGGVQMGVDGDVGSCWSNQVAAFVALEQVPMATASS